MHIFKATHKEKDLARRQFILNILLFCSTFLSFVALLVTLIQDVLLHVHRDGDSTIILFVLFLVFLFSFIASKKGKIRSTAYFFIGFYLILISNAIYRWGPDMPIGLLIYALLIVMSGILINSKFAFVVTAFVSLYLSLLIYLNIAGIIAADQSWKKENVEVVDGILFISIFLIIAIVSWLFNKETEKALRRARTSEKELQEERDSLARKVEEKTKELRQEQADKIAQLYKFAEFGKSASGFLHDLSNSVNLVSSNLRQLENNKNRAGDMKQIVARATVGTKRLEGFIKLTRKQVNNQVFIEYFSINNEILQTIEILNYKARKAHVSVNFSTNASLKTYGNPIKFHQLISNFISNAIDSYEGSNKKGKIVNVVLSKVSNKIRIEIKDFGKGISEENITHIFEPFFTTKGFNKGTGIGLSISHDIAMKDFKAEIQVDSKPLQGSTFTITFPQRTKI